MVTTPAAYRIRGAVPYLMNRVVHRMNDELHARLREQRLSFQHWRVLALLADAGPSTIAELAEYAVIPHSTLSRVLDRMQDHGLLKRTGSREDRRVARIVLTAAGRKRYLGALEATRAVNAHAFAGIAKAEMAMLDRVLERVAQNLAGARANTGTRAGKSA